MLDEGAKEAPIESGNAKVSIDDYLGFVHWDTKKLEFICEHGGSESPGQNINAQRLKGRNREGVNLHKILLLRGRGF
jgi:hypothetical protein